MKKTCKCLNYNPNGWSVCPVHGIDWSSVRKKYSTEEKGRIVMLMRIEGYTFKDAGKIIGLTVERARQLCAKFEYSKEMYSYTPEGPAEEIGFSTIHHWLI